MPIKDYLYRYYNCNIQAPKLKANEIYADKISFDNYSPSNIYVKSGKSDIMEKVHEIQIDSFTNPTVNNCGELIVYALNDSVNLSHVLMAIVTKTNNTISNTNNILIYQTFGNCNVDSTNVPVQPTVTCPDNQRIYVNFPQAMNIRWIWRSYK